MPSWLLLLSQLLVQGVALGCNVVAIGVLPADEVGLISIQTALSAWLYFSHGGSLNHLFNELPRLGGNERAAERAELLRSALGAIVGLALPATMLLAVAAAAIYSRELVTGARLMEFALVTVLSVLGTQWAQVKECEIKSLSGRAELAKWNLLLAVAGLVPLALLPLLPAYEVFLYRAALANLLVLAVVVGRDGTELLKPRFRGILSSLRGGSVVLLAQLAGVLLLQGERLLMAARSGVAAVGEMQLYFIVQTGAQLVPATAMNLWYPQARRDPGSLPAATRKALHFSFGALAVAAAGGAAVAFGLAAGWGGERYERAAAGLLAGSLLMPAFAYASLLFVFLVQGRMLVFVLLQSALFGLQAILYLALPSQLGIGEVVAAREGLLYGGLLMAIVLVRRGGSASKRENPA